MRFDRTHRNLLVFTHLKGIRLDAEFLVLISQGSSGEVKFFFDAVQLDNGLSEKGRFLLTSKLVCQSVEYD